MHATSNRPLTVRVINQTLFVRLPFFPFRSRPAALHPSHPFSFSHLQFYVAPPRSPSSSTVYVPIIVCLASIQSFRTPLPSPSSPHDHPLYSTGVACLLRICLAPCLALSRRAITKPLRSQSCPETRSRPKGMWSTCVLRGRVLA